MKTLYITACFALVIFSSCSSVYRSSQTPDDMYYTSSRQSVGRSASNSENNDDYVQANSARQDGRYSGDASTSGYDTYATPDDRWLMMRVRDQARWSYFDDYNYYSPYNDFAYGGLGGYYGGYGFTPGFSMGLGYGFGGYNPYAFGLGLGYGGFGGMFNSYYNWNSFYNPYYTNMVVINPKLNPAGYTTLRTFNMGGYTNKNYNNGSTTVRSGIRPNYNGYVAPSRSATRIYNPTNSNGYRPANNRNVYYNNGRSDGYNNSRPARIYTPQNSYTPNNSYTPRSTGVSSGSSGNSGGGGGGSVGSRPGRR